MAPRRPARLRSFSYRGKYQYYVTFCTFERRDFFTRTEVVDPVRAQFLQTFQEREFALLAAVFMPDHVHLLIEGLSDDADFKGTMMVARQRWTMAFKQRVATPSLWQDAYFERVLRREDQVHTTASYIVENPVRAGLAEKPEEYPYVWSRFHPALKRLRDGT